jgi:RNA polymerase sigma-70 factor (ECF subfamily)
MPDAPRARQTMEWLRRIERDRARYLRFVSARVASAADAEDVLQRALLHAVSRAETLDDEQRAEAWFFQIVRHAITDHHRGRARERARASDDDVDEAAAPEPADAVCRCGEQLMASLAASHAEMLRRVDAEGESVDAVAQSLDITVGNAYVRLHRARRSLRARVESRCGVHTVEEALSCSCDGC